MKKMKEYTAKMRIEYIDFTNDEKEQFSKNI